MNGISKQFLSIGLILAWFVSPESFVVSDRGAGLAGVNMIAACIAGAALALTASLVIHDPTLERSVRGNDMVLLRKSSGRKLSLALLLAGRIPILLFASTGMLVTAGFTFNEVFVYWFPNFLFASSLLILIAAINCADEKFALWCQFIAVLALAAAVVFLILLGIMGGPPSHQDVAIGEPASPFLPAVLGFLIFLGFDFHRLGAGSRPVVLALVPALVIVSLWVMTAVNHVESDRLARSMVAYMSVARSVGGEAGHLLMGGIIICGVFCGVNGFILAARRMLRDLIGERLFYGGKYGEQFYVCVIMLIIVTMMMTGVAGDRSLELQIRGALVLWMIYLGIKTISAGRMLFPLKRRRGLAGYTVGSIILLFAILLTTYAENSWYIFSFTALTATAAVVVSFFWVRVAAKPAATVSSKEGMP